MKTPSPEHHMLDLGDVRLGYYTLGSSDAPCLFMLHGMRDVAKSLLPIAQPLATDHRIILVDLRGHGSSDKPGIYTIEHYLNDLYRLVQVLSPERPCTLFGHSLGGQIVARFCALFNERVTAAIIVEGLGPPARNFGADADLGAYRERLLRTLAVPTEQQRPLRDVAFAATRLLANNPRLDRLRALELAQLATQINEAGELHWAFDPRAQSTFLSLDQGQSVHYWQNVRCPALIINGVLAWEYWQNKELGETGWTGRFRPGELEARVAHFPHHEHHKFRESGHMVHYDEPERLTRITQDFLERHP